MYSQFWEIVLMPLYILSAFFYSILKKEAGKDKFNSPVISLIVNTVYIFLVSVYLGIILSIFVLTSIVAFTHWNLPVGITNILGGFLFVLVFLGAILLRGYYKDEKFNIPEIIINSITIIISYMKSKQIFKAFALIFFITIFFIASFIMFLDNLQIPEALIPGTVLVIFLISTTLSICTYYLMLPKNSLLKSMRIFSLYLLLSSFLLVLSCYRAYLYTLQGFNAINITDISLLSVNLYMSIKIMPDSWADLYQQFCIAHSEELNKLRKDLDDNYSYKKLLRLLKKLKGNMDFLVNENKKLWRAGKKIKVIKDVTIIIALFSALLWYDFNTDNFQLVIRNFFKWLWTLWVSMIGDEKTASMITYLIALIVAFVWQVVLFIKEFKTSDKNGKMVVIGRIILISMFTLTLICALGSIRIEGIVVNILGLMMLSFIVLSFFIKTKKT